MPEDTTSLLDRLPTALRTIVSAKVAAPPATLGQAVGGIIDDAMAGGWVYDRESDAFTKDGERVMVKVVWRAYVQEAG